MLTLDFLKDKIIKSLDSQFHFSPSKFQHYINLLGPCPVRSGLKGHPHIAHRTSLIFRLNILCVPKCSTVGTYLKIIHCFQTSSNKPVLVANIPGSETPAHYDKF